MFWSWETVFAMDVTASEGAARLERQKVQMGTVAGDEAGQATA